MFSFLNKLTNIQQRIIAGTIGAAIMMAGILINQWTYAALFFFINLFSLNEYHHLLKSAGIRTRLFFLFFSGTVIYSTVFLVEASFATFSAYVFLFPLLFFLLCIELFAAQKDPMSASAYTYFGIVYITVPFSLLHGIAFHDAQYSSINILFILLLIWANDIGGYFGGRRFGKHKLYEKISPQKTWEGSISGAFFALLVMGVVNYFILNISWFHATFIASIVVVAGSLGDLIESQFKRSLQMKDSGHSIPGHGGFLDRFDGFIYTSPFVYMYYSYFV
jgi:phosphatidate cytidylyltransferase